MTNTLTEEQIAPCPFCNSAMIYKPEKDFLGHPDGDSDCPLDGSTWRASSYVEAWNRRADAILSNKMRNALERLAICVTGGYRTTIEAVARDCAPIFEELGMSFDGEGWGFYDDARLSAAIGER